jgi:hypothetical protein
MSDMPFSTQREAKQFLANKIVAEAEREGAPLSDVERRMLLFCEQEPETVTGFPDDVLENIDTEYEERITSLLRAAYERDQENRDEKQRFEDAYLKLQDGDHYLLVMAEPVLGRTALGGTAVRGRFVYIAIGLAVVGAVIAFALWQQAR